MATAVRETLSAASDRRGRDLPVWPLQALFVPFPLWWVLGLAPFAPQLAALPMIAALARRRRVLVPRWFGLWLLYLLAMTLSITQIDTGARMVGAAFRLSTYLSATVVFVYVYNCSPRTLTIAQATRLMIVFWLWIVLGGFCGLLLPDVSISTPVERLMPSAIASNDLVRELVHPSFAEVQNPWGAREPFVRPSAPFPYTNTWGCHYALLVPFLMLHLRTTRGALQRVALLAVAAASLAPAFATLNRGMFLAIGFALMYAAVHFAARGNATGLLLTGGILGGSAIAAYASGLLADIASRTEVSGTNSDRMLIYLEAFERTLQSPLLGYGAPRPSENLWWVPVGTQGQLWNTMFSFGFPALILYILFFVVLTWRTRRLPASLLWLHVVPATALFMLIYYELDSTQLVIIFIAAALGLRHLRGAAEAERVP